MDNNKTGLFIKELRQKNNMKEARVITVILIIILLVTLVIIKKTYVPNIIEEKILTLEEIKERLKETKKIYICRERLSLTHPCPAFVRLKTIEDEGVIKKILDITSDESPDPVTIMENTETIYFMDKNDKVIISGEGFYSYELRTKNKRYQMDLSRIEELRELVGYPNGN